MFKNQESYILSPGFWLLWEKCEELAMCVGGASARQHLAGVNHGCSCSQDVALQAATGPGLPEGV